MAVEITGYLMLEEENVRSLLSNRTINYIISLDEGHDRPVWEWVKTPVRGKKSAWVPEKPDTILLDGLLMMIADGLENPRLKPTIDTIRTGSNSLVDLNANLVGAALRANSLDVLKDFKICVVALPGSSLLALSQHLDGLGLESRLLSQ